MKLNHEIFHKFFRAGETEWAAIANETEDRKKRNELISGLMAKREAAAKRKAAAEKRKHAEFLKQFSDVPYSVEIEVGEPIK